VECARAFLEPRRARAGARRVASKGVEPIDAMTTRSVVVRKAGVRGDGHVGVRSENLSTSRVGRRCLVA
jgi:hypothetical protein